MAAYDRLKEQLAARMPSELGKDFDLILFVQGYRALELLRVPQPRRFVAVDRAGNLVVMSVPLRGFSHARIEWQGMKSTVVAERGVLFDRLDFLDGSPTLYRNRALIRRDPDAALLRNFGI